MVQHMLLALPTRNYPKISPFGLSHHGSVSDRHTPSLVAAELANVVLLLVKSSLQPSSIPRYQRAWNLYYQFLFHTFPSSYSDKPVPPATLALFIAYLFDQHYAPSTVNTYVSAIGYTHKLTNFPDPSNCFFFMQMLKGYRKKGQRVDTRLPITLPILHKLVDSAESFSCPNYTKVQFCAMCSLAFYAFLRVGEMTAPNKGACPPIQLCLLILQERLCH
ncbi:uncharacterized protein LOC141887177 [Acropora palmata]|uniref:uncharacterized protein LOC141887177 n=1 Tax=Acropora palmata TaxID=6131 RepID=UPI003DA14E91